MSTARIIPMKRSRPTRSRQTQPSHQAGWLTWSDPREDEKDYDKWRKLHRDHLLLKVKAELEKASVGTDEAPINLMAARAGLCSSTVSKYVRKLDMGKRGPLATTLFALLTMKDDA